MCDWETLLVASVILILLVGRQISDVGRDFANDPARQSALRRALLAIFAFIVLGMVYAILHAR
jgi:hypothetical protein